MEFFVTQELAESPSGQIHMSSFHIDADSTSSRGKMIENTAKI